jgi:hypothetical protein
LRGIVKAGVVSLDSCSHPARDWRYLPPWLGFGRGRHETSLGDLGSTGNGSRGLGATSLMHSFEWGAGLPQPRSRIQAFAPQRPLKGEATWPVTGAANLLPNRLGADSRGAPAAVRGASIFFALPSDTSSQVSRALAGQVNQASLLPAQRLHRIDRSGAARGESGRNQCQTEDRD